MGREKGKIRVLLAKPRVDSHDRGIRYVAQRLRDAGMEVIFMQYLDVQEVAIAARQEDVDALGLSFLSGGHGYDVPYIMNSLKENNMSDIPVIIGGRIPRKEVSTLLDIGVKGYFGKASDLDRMIGLVESLVPQGREG